MNWKKIKLGELITESRIPSINPDPDRRITVRLNVLGVEKRPLENEKAGATKQFIRKAGQFIYGKQNFHKGAFGIIPPELDGFESSADLPSFDVRKDCLPDWIFYFFKQGGFYLELAKIARGVATQRIHPEQIYDLEISLPDLNTQKKIIANIISIQAKADKLNGELSCQLTLLDSLNQAILQEAVQGKLVPQDKNDEPASELLKRIKAEKAKSGKKEKPLPPIKPEEIPFEIPENWVWCRLGEICERIHYGFNASAKPSNSGVRLLRITDIQENAVDWETVPGCDYTNSDLVNYLLNENDIVIARTGGTIGKTYLVKSIPLQSLFASYLIRAIPSKAVFPEYAKCFMESPIYWKQLYEAAGGAAQPNVNGTSLSNLLFPLPPLSEQKRIVAEIEKQFAKTKQLKEHIIANQQATEQLLKALLHQAFEVGEIRRIKSCK